MTPLEAYERWRAMHLRRLQCHKLGVIARWFPDVYDWWIS